MPNIIKNTCHVIEESDLDSLCVNKISTHRMCCFVCTYSVECTKKNKKKLWRMELDARKMFSCRIINEESKSCPICRGIIDKVRKLQIVWNKIGPLDRFSSIVFVFFTVAGDMLCLEIGTEANLCPKHESRVCVFGWPCIFSI